MSVTPSIHVDSTPFSVTEIELKPFSGWIENGVCKVNDTHQPCYTLHSPPPKSVLSRLTRELLVKIHLLSQLEAIDVPE